ncbi:MAG: 3-oxoacyl-ACP reductase [Gammaproteobacteria bacterium TMED133]|nr:MAG: 3-oxoacyl-ACP reductase [Gammaproteobacteria bacterium TMED133]
MNMKQAKVAIVTGGGSGIGKHSALALLREGYSVTIAGRREAKLNDVVKQSGGDSKLISVVTDIANPDSVGCLFAKTIEKFGRLDVLFNNAGTGAPSIPLEELSFEQWAAVVNVNLTGAFLCTQQAFRVMKNQSPMGGRIINNGSISAHVPRPNSSPYTATKHAITGLTRSSSLDGRKYNIVCSQIDIGNALTEMTARMGKGVPQADGTLKVEPTMDVQHVANAVVQIANLPLESNVQFMTIMASNMPFIGRG